MWRKVGDVEETVELSAGVSLTIPRGAHFQFRNLEDRPLEVVLVTMPPWPGDEQAVRVEDHWPVAEA
jgi:mannose-6-phosphate isomerase-like protein (cupin superfamily)